MASRYEIVEPEAMEVAEDDVYHPNQSVREISNSVRSLEPIIDGSIGLKTIFYDSRWSRTQRRFCVGILVVFVVICFSLLISLFVGLAKVINFIHYTERIRSTGESVNSAAPADDFIILLCDSFSGLMMFPSTSNPIDVPTINYCGGASSCQGNFSVFTNAIDRVLQSTSFVVTVSFAVTHTICLQSISAPTRGPIMLIAVTVAKLQKGNSVDLTWSGWDPTVQKRRISATPVVNHVYSFN